MARSRAVSRQFVLFCNCGQATPVAADRCLSRHSRVRLAGFREEVLDRDGRVYRTCGEMRLLVVHRRHPGLGLTAIGAWIPGPLWCRSGPSSIPVPPQPQLSTVI